MTAPRPPSTVEPVRTRLDPPKVDLLLAGALVVGVELQVWLGGGSMLHRTLAALVGATVTGSVAVRRRFPTAVGFGVQGILALDSVLSGKLPVGFVTIAWFCA